MLRFVFCNGEVIVTRLARDPFTPVLADRFELGSGNLGDPFWTVAPADTPATIIQPANIVALDPDTQTQPPADPGRSAK